MILTCSIESALSCILIFDHYRIAYLHSFPSSFEVSSGSTPVAVIINIIKPHSFASTLSTVTQSSSIQKSSAPVTKKAEHLLDKSSVLRAMCHENKDSLQQEFNFVVTGLEPNHRDNDMMAFSKKYWTLNL